MQQRQVKTIHVYFFEPWCAFINHKGVQLNYSAADGEELLSQYLPKLFEGRDDIVIERHEGLPPRRGGLERRTVRVSPSSDALQVVHE